jgi:hypothetical protein
LVIKTLDLELDPDSDPHWDLDLYPDPHLIKAVPQPYSEVIGVTCTIFNSTSSVGPRIPLYLRSYLTRSGNQTL